MASLNILETYLRKTEEKLSLKCPLCCNGSFSSHESLKNHLSLIINNIYCPACNKQCTNVLELTKHLEKKCEENDETGEHVILNEDICEHPITRSVNDEKEKMELVPGGPEKPNINKYFCESCYICFENMEEHLEQYHQGQILVETENGDMQIENAEEEEEESIYSELPDEGTTVTSENDNIHFVKREEEEEEEEEGESEAEVLLVTNDSCDVNKVRPVEKIDLVDKNGRFYTRRVVRIETFFKPSENTTASGVFARKAAALEHCVEVADLKSQNLPENELKIMADSKIVKIFKCLNCLNRFSTQSGFDKHLCTNFNERFQCDVCSAVFVDLPSLIKHKVIHCVPLKSDHDDDDKNYVCDVCNTRFLQKRALSLHKRMHTNVKKDPTIIPPVTYGLFGENVPINDVSEHPDDTFLCKVCNKTYNVQYRLVHLASHENVENYMCSVCNKMFFTKENLEMHSKIHALDKKHYCLICKKFVDTADALTEHLKTHSKDRKHECQYCGRKFTKPHEKVKHERIHTGDKPHSCEICGKCFRVSYCLTLHMRTHTGVRPYTCPHCGKRFKSHGAFNHHIQIHSEDRKYKCTFCPKAFKTSVQLAGHKNCHTKPFSCTTCNRPFASLYAVRAHMEVHNRKNNLKYACSFCGAGYARPYALRDHLKTAHSEDLDANAVDRLLASEGSEIEDEDRLYEIEVVVPRRKKVKLEISKTEEEDVHE